jgi:transcriptional regulator with GAF, ATPase, and Fis domain
MGIEEKIDIDIFKAVTRAIAKLENLEMMTNHLTQLLVGALDIKGCTIFALNPENSELEVLASFGLSISYLNKGPLLSKKSIKATLKGEPIVIRDIHNTDRLQYPAETKKEEIGAIVALPIKLYDKVIGELRLYHHRAWEISGKDLDSLLLLSEIIGLAMTYTRLLYALKDVKDTVNSVHSIWFDPVSS